MSLRLANFLSPPSTQWDFRWRRRGERKVTGSPLLTKQQPPCSQDVRGPIPDTVPGATGHLSFVTVCSYIAHKKHEQFFTDLKLSLKFIAKLIHFEKTVHNTHSLIFYKNKVTKKNKKAECLPLIFGWPECSCSKARSHQAAAQHVPWFSPHSQ